MNGYQFTLSPQLIKLSNRYKNKYMKFLKRNKIVNFVSSSFDAKVSREPQ